MKRRPAFILLACTLSAGLSLSQVRTPGTESLYAPHGEPGRYFNPWEPAPARTWPAIRWLVFSRNPYDKSREPAVPRVDNDGRYLSGATEDGPTLTWIGHSTFAIHDGHDVVLTDPHFGRRAAIRARLHPPGIPIEAIPPDAFAVISHNHYDHLDASTVEGLPDTIRWYVPKGLESWFRKRDRHNVVELDWWQQDVHGRWTVTCLPSQHWSRRGLTDTDATLWCTWLLDSGEHRYFFAGDTGYFHGFAEFGRRFGPIDVALLPIGAYEPRWFMKYQHMNPAEAYRAFVDLRARFMLSMHWGTFDLTDEPLDLPPRVFDEVVREVGGDPARARNLAIGERFELPPRTPVVAER